MKKGLTVSFMLIIFFAGTGFCQDEAALKTSTIAADSIAGFYKAMARAVDNGLPTDIDFKARLDYLNRNKDEAVLNIMQAKAYNHIGAAHQMVEMLYRKHSSHLSYTPAKIQANGQAYFDSQTGHRYIRQNEHTYAEFTKKGELLKTV